VAHSTAPTQETKESTRSLRPAAKRKTCIAPDASKQTPALRHILSAKRFWRRASEHHGPIAGRSGNKRQRDPRGHQISHEKRLRLPLAKKARHKDSAQKVRQQQAVGGIHQAACLRMLCPRHKRRRIDAKDGIVSVPGALLQRHVESRRDRNRNSSSRQKAVTTESRVAASRRSMRPRSCQYIGRGESATTTHTHRQLHRTHVADASRQPTTEMRATNGGNKMRSARTVQQNLSSLLDTSPPARRPRYYIEAASPRE